MALNAGGGSFAYGEEILNEFGPAVSPLDPSFLSSTARRLSTGGFPGPSVLGLPTTALSPPSDLPAPRVEPDGEGYEAVVIGEGCRVGGRLAGIVGQG